MGALTGVRVLDFTRVLAGPFCTMMLGDLGADVIKVEGVAEPDETRGWAPPSHAGESAYYLCVNRNKRAIALDLKHPLARPVFERLVQRADIVIHNYRPESAERLGLAYHQVRSINPDIIYCGISGYGKDSGKPGYDYILQAVGGLMSITGPPDGPPMKVGVAVTDLMTGLSAATAILAALRHRDVTGQGQEIDMSLYDTQIAMLANVASNVLVSHKDAPRLGNAHPNIVPYQLFEVQDGYVVITVGNDRQFQAFCEALGFDDLATDPSFQTNEQRVRARDILVPELERRIRHFRRDELLERLEAAHVPCGPVKSVEEALSSPDTERRQLIWQVPDGSLAGLKLVGSHLRLQQTPPELRQSPPKHGQHSQEVLRELGYSDSYIQQLIAKGVIVCSTSR
jgi:crotonobetainyl-CoA:carnitine CoA-transferase CaiB-like acyl-CoA transferase